MSWNIAKPGDQINGPVSITGALTSSSTISGTQIISTVATGTAPLTVSSTTNVTNLNADLLDGQQGSYYQSADNINAGTLVVGRGGTGASTFTAGRVLFGNGTSALNTSANLFWDNSNNSLGIGTATPSYYGKIAVVGDIAPVSPDGVTQGIFRASNDGTITVGGYNASSTNYIKVLAGGATERLRIASDGVCTWSNVGGVVSNAMVLNGTGLGVGVSPSYKLDVNSSTLSGQLRIFGSNQNSITIGNAAGTSGNGFLLGRSYTSNNANDFFIFDLTASAPRFAIDSSGNCGIGITTPSTYGKLVVQVNGASQSGLAFVDTNTSGRSWLIGPGTGTGIATDFGFYDNTGTQIASLYTAGASGKWAWYTNGAERLRIDSSGNLGLGVTPSAWVGGRALDVGASGSLFGDGLSYDWRVGISTGIYRSGSPTSWFYKTTGQSAGAYQIWASGATGVTHAWYSVGSGTVNNAAALNTQMVLDASGNLMVGTVVASDRLNIAGGIDLSGATTGQNIRFTNSGTNGTPRLAAQLTYRSSSYSGAVFIASYITGAFDDSNDLRFYTGGGNERLRIKSTGQVNFVGLSSDPAGAAAGDVYYNTTTNKLKCYNGTTWNDLF